MSINREFLQNQNTEKLSKAWSFSTKMDVGRDCVEPLYIKAR